MRLVVCTITCIVVLFIGGGESPGQIFSPHSVDDWSPGQYYSMGVKKFFNSFTSYQFPNPFPPQQDPLSRLEFPIDQWFVGLFSGYSTPSWRLLGQLWTNVNRESALRMQDSDWDDESHPFQKTIFSESNSRLNRSYIVDVGVSVATPMSVLADIRPVFGCRYQYFNFTTHDGEQISLGGEAQELPGDGIDFRQTFYHWYLGASLNTGINLAGMVQVPRPIVLDVQFDYALVTAKNEDLHLLRSGDRVTIENTRGHCWHLAVGLSILYSNTFRARVEADFKRVVTDGAHRLTNPLFDLDFSFDGSKVWSDQAAISALGEMAF
jgi:hypothetical protein